MQHTTRHPLIFSQVKDKLQITTAYAKTCDRPIDSFEIFEKRFEAFTQGRLKNLNWDNIAVIGGAVIIPLCHHVPEQLFEFKPNETQRNFYFFCYVSIQLLFSLPLCAK